MGICCTKKATVGRHAARCGHDAPWLLDKLQTLDVRPAKRNNALKNAALWTAWLWWAAGHCLLAAAWIAVLHVLGLGLLWSPTE
jgi:hypothetical protein